MAVTVMCVCLRRDWCLLTVLKSSPPLCVMGYMSVTHKTLPSAVFSLLADGISPPFHGMPPMVHTQCEGWRGTCLSPSAGGEWTTSPTAHIKCAGALHGEERALTF